MVDDQPGGEPAQRGADALSGGDRPLRHIVMPGAAHQIGDQQRGYRAENPGADTIEQLHTDQPSAAVGEGIEHGAHRQDAEPDQAGSACAPSVSAVRPTTSAIGSMIICAAMMQADIIAVAHF